MNKQEDWLGKPLYDKLDGAEKDFADALLAISEKYGPLDDESDTPTGPWVGYVGPEQNEDREIGVKCGNCALIASENACAIIAGEINPEGKCRLAVIPPGYVSQGDEETVERAWGGFFLPVISNG